jgi:L-sorbose 1-phosphate reductase
MNQANPLPATQFAVQLVGPGQLTLNRAKEVPRPGPHQILARIEAVGLCFSDLKLLKQFAAHPRKSEITSGIAPAVLAGIPSYVPNEKPTVPGHEACCRIVAIGDQVKSHRVGERCLVQTDYRALPTAHSNAAFGYNFEGSLQEYVLMDERVVIDPASGERFLIPVSEDLGASAVALVEPWACVENSYVSGERRNLKPDGRLLIVADTGHTIDGLRQLGLSPKSGIWAVVSDESQKQYLHASLIAHLSSLDSVPDESFDDIIYFGASKATIELLNDKLASRGVINIVLGGRRIGQPVSVGVGRVHYGMTRWIGTTGANAAESYGHIPETGELRRGEKVVVIGAGGPMGQMHVIRNICSGIEGISVTGTDVDDARLYALAGKARPLAQQNSVTFRLLNTKAQPLHEKFGYFALLVPAGGLVADAIRQSLDGCIINIFAGIPAATRQDLDLDTYITNRCYMLGTSGSVIRDMNIVLRKVVQNQLDTNCSLDAICGMAGAIDGIAAVENRTLAGKIIVYPMLHDVGLIPLTELRKHYPTVAAMLNNGQWTVAAEEELLRVATQ